GESQPAAATVGEGLARARRGSSLVVEAGWASQPRRAFVGSCLVCARGGKWGWDGWSLGASCRWSSRGCGRFGGRWAGVGGGDAGGGGASDGRGVGRGFGGGGV